LARGQGIISAANEGGFLMPRINVEGFLSFDVPEGKRLVRALEENGVDILHRCGGNARRTTCGVEFIAGEPDQMTRAERDKLTEKNLIGQARLSCQILTNHDMTGQAGLFA
jgi:ferredoxin